MKKKLLLPLFVLMAVISSAALMSCGGDDDKESVKTTDEQTASAGGDGQSSQGDEQNPGTSEQDPQTVSVNGHDFVDLGLPSGTLWATCNVGADSPVAYGEYFAWGETTAKTAFSWVNYKWCDGDEDKITKYGDDGKTELDSADDAATAGWGAPCRMPTMAEYKELCENCTCERGMYRGVFGCKVTSRKTGNYIFFPAAGFFTKSGKSGADSYCWYWSATLNDDLVQSAYALYSDYYTTAAENFFGRIYGLPVRPVASVK